MTDDRSRDTAALSTGAVIPLGRLLPRHSAAQASRAVDAVVPSSIPDGGAADPTALGHDVTAPSRRGFLSLMGFSVGAATVAACRAPVQHAIPLPIGSDQIVPGVSLHYATTCAGCSSACSVLVKQRDGRPIKIEGNPESTVFAGGTCAAGQATLLSLYDGGRLRGPLLRGKDASWSQVDEQIKAMLARTPAGRKVVLLSGTVVSPSTRAIIASSAERVPGFHHVSYDAVSASALRAAAGESFGSEMIPHYAFDKARVIVGLEADFLGTWLSPVEFSRQYARARRADGPSLLHVQIESGVSLTGSNADQRIVVSPSELPTVAVALLARLAKRAGLPPVATSADVAADARLDSLADKLWQYRGSSLVVSGSNDRAVQVVVNGINSLLDNVGRTIDVTRPSLQRQGDDRALATLIDDMNRGEIHAIFIYGVNPGYDHPNADAFVAALGKVPLSVSFADRVDETARAATAVCPDNHHLESWGDAEPVVDRFSLSQPLIAPIFDTRAVAESLLRWTGDATTDHRSYIQDYWRKNLFTRQSERATFEGFWDHALQLGTFDAAAQPATAATATAPAAKAGAEAPAKGGDWRSAAAAIAAERARSSAHADSGYELHLYESIPMRDGRHANNPWLQELPDPIAKTTWGNFAAVSPTLASSLDLADGDIVSLEADDRHLELPVVVQPGQHARTISVALGYGRERAGRAGDHVGANGFALTTFEGGFRRYGRRGVSLSKTGRHEDLARTQRHFSMEGRPLAQQTSRAELRGPKHREEHEGGAEGETGEELPSLWAKRLTGEHAWGMSIDLNACTGCSACVVACQAENNTAVVGKDQIQRQRTMHWMRIDSYSTAAEGTEPVTIHQPMLCQHCQNAPCETVCPVVATTTSSEGLNQQTYNRCIGTRYCANNCPYKVRRFNWLEYTDSGRNLGSPMETPIGRLVLNPDVTVRTRGVMEKCSLCVQRIQLGKNLALQAKRPMADGDVQTACQQGCPTGAIVFGDLKDPNSRVSRLLADKRAYRVLDDLGTRPNVGYLKRVRDTEGT